MKKFLRPMTLALAAGSVLGAAASAWAQFATTVEAPLYNGSTTGVLLTNGSNAPGGGGQQDWYIPVAGSFEQNVFVYVGNAPPWATAGPIPLNPFGNAQFGMGFTDFNGAQNNTRAQHEVDLSAGTAWSAQYDQLVRYDGPPAATYFDNIASFSLQPSTTNAAFQNLTVWTNTTSNTQCNIRLGCATAASPTALDTTLIPGPPFVGVPTNHWIRLKYWFDFSTRTVNGASIQDITAGGPAFTIDVSGNGWWLLGGPTGVQPRPTAFRMFANGTETSPAGHVIAWDNITFQQETFTAPSGACCLPNGTCANAQTFNQCTTQSGVYRGDTVLCASVTCPQPAACCFADGTCQTLNSVQCAAASGIYRGDGTNCSPNLCPQPGACCLADGTCQSLLPAACAARTGVYRGAGVTCVSITCPQPYDFETSSGDAGESIATAPRATGTGVLPGIVGGSIGTEDVDMYGIQICDLASFRASTVTWTQGATGVMDSMLFLFRENGTGVVMDDDNPGTGVESALTNANIPGPGKYYLAICGWDRGPVGTPNNAATRIWATQAPQNAVPNGPGAAAALGGWMNFGIDPATGNPAATGFYTIAFYGACRWDTAAACYPNCDNSTTNPCLNVLDFSCFLNKFAAADPFANCDLSTTPPVLNVLDFSCFLNKFAAGCSAC